ncbi:MAG: hypothetical protein ACR2OU_05105 [Thermomicrobiales bacterium]
MADKSWLPNHTQLLSVRISFGLGEGRGTRPYFLELGYELNAIEFPLLDREGRPFEPDLHLLCVTRNCSLLIECKSGEGGVRGDQLAKYMATTGVEVISAGVSVTKPLEHDASSAFFILPSVMQSIVSQLMNIPDSVEAQWAVVEVKDKGIVASHNQIGDEALSASLQAGWDVDLSILPQGRLRFESDASRVDLSDAVFRSLIGMLARHEMEFSIEDLCRDMNPLWDFYIGKHVALRKRIRPLMSHIRRVALKRWIEVVPNASTVEDRWKYTREFGQGTNSIRTLQAIHQKYLAVSVEGQEPKATDFVGLDAEQYLVPIRIESGQLLISGFGDPDE